MIKIPFSTAIAVFLSVPLLLVFSRWIFYNFFRECNQNNDLSKYLQRCPYCSYMFFDYRESLVKRCPRCQSFISRGKEEKDGYPMENSRNNSGVALLTVIITIMILSVIAVSVMSINMSQVASIQSMIDTLKAEQLAVGTFFKYHQAQLDGVVINSGTETIDGKNFGFSISTGVSSSGLNETRPVNITISY
jgi:hypothetical protein